MERERLSMSHERRMLGTVSAGNATVALGTLTLAPLLPAIIDGLGITSFRAGLALSVMWGLNAIAQYPGGRLADRTTRKTALVTALSSVVLGLLVLIVSWEFVGFLLGAAIIGTGVGLYSTSAYALLSDLFDGNQGSAFGVYTAHWDLGGALSAGLAVVVLAVAGWRAAFLPVVALALVILVLVHRWGEESYTLARPTLDLAGTVDRLFGDRTVRRLIFAYALYLFTWQGAISFFPTYLQAEKGLDPTLASGAFASLFVVGVVVKPLAGAVGDRAGRVLVALGALVIGAAGLAAVVVATAVPVIAGSVLLFAVGLMAFSPPMLAHVMSIFPETSAGGDFGGVRAAYLGIGSLGPTYVGYVAGAASYGTAFVGLVACLLASTAVLLWTGWR